MALAYSRDQFQSEDQMGPLMDATNVIDEQTTITP